MRFLSKALPCSERYYIETRKSVRNRIGNCGSKWARLGGKKLANTERLISSEVGYDI
jgi:hypothetical protein